jgi:micrococcal nuclease
VIDGDTIDVKLNGKKERVRLIGINTPETVDKRRPIQCFGPEASKRTHELLDHHAVRLEAGAEDRDKYGRLLRFVFSEDATNVGQRLISEGYAQEYTYQGQSYRYQSEFKRAETEAKSAGRGLWSAGACNGDLNHAVS